MNVFSFVFSFIYSFCETLALFIQQMCFCDEFEEEEQEEQEQEEEPEEEETEDEETEEEEQEEETEEEEEQTPVVKKQKMELYTITPANEKELFKNQRFKDLLTGSKIVVAVLQQKGKDTYRTTAISMRQLRKAVKNVLNLHFKAKTDDKNNIASMREMSRYVFSKTGTKLRIKLQNTNEKQFYVKFNE